MLDLRVRWEREERDLEVSEAERSDTNARNDTSTRPAVETLRLSKLSLKPRVIHKLFAPEYWEVAD
jgi:hypothetical protein